MQLEVLFIDDDPLEWEAISRLLGEREYLRFDWAEDAETARALGNVVDYDVVITDLMLQDGRTALEVIRDACKFGKPVLVHSNYVGGPAVERAIQEGYEVAGVIPKANGVESLLKSLEQFAGVVETAVEQQESNDRLNCVLAKIQAELAKVREHANA